MGVRARRVSTSPPRAAWRRDPALLTERGTAVRQLARERPLWFDPTGRRCSDPARSRATAAMAAAVLLTGERPHCSSRAQARAVAWTDRRSADPPAGTAVRPGPQRTRWKSRPCRCCCASTTRLDDFAGPGKRLGSSLHSEGGRTVPKRRDRRHGRLVAAGARPAAQREGSPRVSEAVRASSRRSKAFETGIPSAGLPLAGIGHIRLSDGADMVAGLTNRCSGSRFRLLQAGCTRGGLRIARACRVRRRGEPSRPTNEARRLEIGRHSRRARRQPSCSRQLCRPCHVGRLSSDARSRGAARPCEQIRTRREHALYDGGKSRSALTTGSAASRPYSGCEDEPRGVKTLAPA